MDPKKPRRRRSSIVPREGSNQVGNFSTRFSLPSFVKRVNKLTEIQRDAIHRTGLGNLLFIPNHMLSKNLLVELMERWNPKKCAFVLAPGEVTVTLLDVAVILGLRVTGERVFLREDAPFLEVEKEYGAALWNRKITVASLEDRLEVLGERDDEDFVRTFLLFTFGTILFPNTNGKVDSRYLSLLQDLNKVCDYAWGIAVLQDLQNWLRKRKEMNFQYVGGCLILLQVWSYEHIDIARPSLQNHSVKFPRACRWENSKSHQRQWFISKFKELQLNQITWNFELTYEESEAEIIRELPEALQGMTNIGLELHSSADNSSADEHNMWICHERMEHLVLPKNNMEANLAHKVQKDYPNTLKSSWNPATVSTGHSYLSLPSYDARAKEKPEEHLRVPEDNSYVVIISDDDDGDDLILEHRVLEEENTKLRIENNDLREEITFVKTKLSLRAELEQQNAKLRKEVETLRQENQELSLSACSLVARLERLVYDGSSNDIGDQNTQFCREMKPGNEPSSV